MELLLLLINVAGAVTLLLWSVRMVRTGFERANGDELRAAVRRSETGRIKAAIMGTGVAMLLQSSTAVAVLAAGFASSEILSVCQGIALLLGADLGSAIVAQLLSFNVQWLVPVCLIVGGLLFFKGQTSYLRQIGRIIMGIGLILISLRFLSEATVPLKDSEFLASVMHYLNDDIITSFLVGALVTWLLHSSIASVLLISTLLMQSVVPWGVGLGFVLGANLGSGLIAFMLTREQPARGRRIPIANLIFRGALAIIIMIVIKWFALPVPQTAADAGLWVVYAHVAFNVLMLVVCLPLAGPMEKLTEKLIPEPVEEGARLTAIHARNSALDPNIVHLPQLALASASRECLHMADVLESMLKPVMSFYENPDPVAMQEVLDLEQVVNKMNSNIKLYIADIDDNNLSEEDADRKLALINFAINLESVGDVIAKNLLKLAETKNRECLEFSPQGWAELIEVHENVISNMHLSLNTMVSGDQASARQLIEEKDRIRHQERNSNVQHFQRLQSGSSASIETSDIHLETLRALRQINSLFAAVAYPILSQSGDLLDSRLTKIRRRGSP